MVTLPDAILDCRSPILDCAARVQIPWSHWAGEKLVLTELEGRLRDTCFCCAGWNDVASERSLSPPCEGGQGGVMREPWKSKTILVASREGCERTERERVWEDLVTGRAGTTPPNPNTVEIAVTPSFEGTSDSLSPCGRGLG